jgi:hypothetical protein
MTLLEKMTLLPTRQSWLTCVGQKAAIADDRLHAALCAGLSASRMAACAGVSVEGSPWNFKSCGW